MTNQETNPEELETAAEQNYVVSVGLKDGFKLKHQPRVVVVQAFSIAGAKKKAVELCRVKQYKHMGFACWKFYSVEVVKNDAQKPEESNVENENI